ncbi:MAG: sulfatase [Planctomycetes bacterium]|nr:sulfatase [Planctomycetota bacterium]
MLSYLLLSLVAQSALDEAPARQNILFILVDDLGVMDVSPMNPESFYETPALERLAATGMRFTNGYAACPVCSPTRASILTGKYPQRVGITDYISPNGGNQPEKWRRSTRLLPAPYADRLAHEEVTLAEVLKDAGYATFFAGKWHLGPEGWWPEDQGFDENQGGITRGGPYGGKRYFSPYGNPRLEDGPEGEHLPSRLARETADFIAENHHQPWLAYLSFYSVHTPLLAREDLIDKYRAKKKRLGLSEVWGQEGERAVRLAQEHAVYAGMVEAMDEAVGVVLAALDETGQADRTVVVFFSDNGGLSTSEGHPTSNLPFRAGKGWMYEGGIREPLLVRAPGLTAAGSVNETVVSSIDFFPTLLDLCGIDSNIPFDGKSFVAALAGEEVERGPIYWHYPHYGNQGGMPSAAVRDGDWKLIHWFETDKLELFRLDLDVSEQYDLAGRYPDKAQQLSTSLNTWLVDVGAKFAMLNNKPLDQVVGPKGVDRLSWMAGHWIREEGGSQFEEAWLGPRGGTMFGVNRTSEKDRTIAAEQLRIFESEGDIWYEVSPPEQAAMRFRLTSANGERAIFENSEQDFPQVIEYIRDGDELRAVARGKEEDGTEVEVRFNWALRP